MIHAIDGGDPQTIYKWRVGMVEPNEQPAVRARVSREPCERGHHRPGAVTVQARAKDAEMSYLSIPGF
jgi:hypothetical protein